MIRSGSIPSICENPSHTGHAPNGLLKENKLNFRIVHAYPNDMISISSKIPLDTNKWYHIAISYNGSSRANGVDLYIDGKKVNVTTEYDQLKKHIRSYPSVHKVSAFRGLDFGTRELDRSMPGGEIDEFQLFNDVLIPEEVTHLYALQPFPINRKAIY